MPTRMKDGKEQALKFMINLPTRNLIAVADAIGNIFLIDTRTNEMDIVKTLTTET